MNQVATLINKLTDFGFDATACYSTDPTKSVCYGEHKIICVRGFSEYGEAYEYAIAEVVKLQLHDDGSRPERFDYRGADCYYDWRFLSDMQLKRNISRKTGVKESQLIIKPRF